MMFKPYNTRTLAFPLFVLVALGLLAWTEARLAQEELEKIDRTFESLMISKLKELEGGFFLHLGNLERDLVDKTSPGSFPKKRKNIHLPLSGSGGPPFNFFAVASEGAYFFPDLDRIPPATGSPNVQQPGMELVFAFLRDWAAKNSQPRSGHAFAGWRSWSSASEAYLFFLNYREDGTLVAKSFSVRDLFTNFCHSLPPDFLSDFPASQTVILLTDPADRPVGSLGKPDPNGFGPPKVALLLRKPLESFRLKFFTPREQVVESLQSVAFWKLAGMLLFAILGLGGLALHIARETDRERAEALAKVSFVNRVSHELKTPLTNMKLYMDLLHMQLPGEAEEEQDLCRVVSSEIDRLSALIDHILTFARIQDNPFKPQPRSVCLNQVLNTVLASFRPVFESRGIRVDAVFMEEREVSLDPEILSRILENLMSNVLKYAAAGTVLKIQTICDASGLRVWISDRGPGIPADLEKRLFEPFLRGDNSVNSQEGGTGLGLSIARELARSHGGDLVLVGNNGPVPGQEGELPPSPMKEGCCFLVRLALMFDGGKKNEDPDRG
jgi:signal transduction histidine kinase